MSKKKGGVKSRIAKEQLEQRYGTWWEINNVEILQSILDEIDTIEAKTKAEKHIRDGMFFRILARRQSLLSKEDND